MVDVGDKTITSREAIASGVVVLNRKIMQKIKDNSVKKGDVITVARIAAVSYTHLTLPTILLV